MSGPRFAGAVAGPFGLGTAPLAGLFAPVDADQAQATMEAAWQGGVRYFDTAPHYGAGVAERRLGEFLRSKPRDEALVSTKVGRLLVPGAAGPVDAGFHVRTGLVRVFDFTADGVRRSLDDSLERSGLDRFDLVLIHDPDEHWQVAIDQAYPTLERLRAEGVVGAIGVGMNQSAMLTRFVRETDVDAVLVAGRYTLLDRPAAADLLPAALDRGVTVLAAGVFNSGVLADPQPGATFNYAPVEPAVLARAQRLHEICRSYGVPLAAAAVQFPLRHPAVTGLVVGARSAAEVRQDLELIATQLPADLWTALAEET